MRKKTLESKSGNRRTYTKIIVKEGIGGDSKSYHGKTSADSLKELAVFTDGKEFENSPYYPQWLDGCDFEDAYIVVITDAMKLTHSIESILERKHYYFPQKHRTYKSSKITYDDVKQSLISSNFSGGNIRGIGWRNIVVRALPQIYSNMEKNSSKYLETKEETTKVSVIHWLRGDFYSGALIGGRIRGGKIWDGLLYNVAMSDGNRSAYIDEGVEIYRCKEVEDKSFKDTTLVECTLTDCVLKNCKILDCVLVDCEVINCTLNYTSISEHDSVSLRDTIIKKTDINLDGSIESFNEVLFNVEMDDYSKNNIVDDVSEDILYKGTIYE